MNVLSLSLVLTSGLAAQATAGYAPSRWTSLKPLPHGWVDRSTLDVHLVFPIFNRNTGTRAQIEGRLVYDSDIWADSGGTWTPQSGGGWRFESNSGGTISLSSSTIARCYNGRILAGYADQNEYFFTAPDGTTAPVGSWITTWGTGCGRQRTSYSGTTVVQASHDSYTVYASSSGGNSAYDSEGDNALNEFEDPSGNAVTYSSGVYSDPLGSGALTVAGSSPITYTYTGPGSSSATVTENLETISVSANFGCYNAYSGNLTVVSSIVYPDGETYSFQYNSDGQLSEMLLPTGATVYFTPTESCSAGAVSTGLDRYDSVNGQSKEWAWSDSGGTTTETTPDGNQSVYTFTGSVLTGVAHYNGSVSPSNEISSVGIVSSSPNGYIASQTSTTELFGATPLYSVHTAAFDAYGKITASSTNDWSTSPGGGATLRSTSATWGVVGSNSDDQESAAIMKGPGGDTEAQTSWAYTSADEIQTVTRQTGSAALATQYAFNTNGTLATVTAPNGAATSYTYGDCNGLLPTVIQSPIAAVKTTLAWNCAGGVKTSSTDGNNQTTTYNYQDPSHTWLLTSVVDPEGDTTNITQTANASGASTNFNGSVSTLTTETTLGVLGLPTFRQRETGPNASSYDTVQTQYDAMGRPDNVSQPYDAGLSLGPPSGTDWTQLTYDALSRPSATVAANGDETVRTYSQNDVKITVENNGVIAETREEQFDALGRLVSVCEINSLPQSGSCGQSVGQTGYLTTYTRDGRGDITKVSQNTQPNSAGSETRSFTFDELGRLTAETNPETGTTDFYFGSAAPGCAAQTGNLSERKDAVGNVTCYAYDALNRVTGTSYPGGTTPSRTFVYGAATVGSPSMGTKGVMNTVGRLAEAYTGNRATDLGFSYTTLGQINGTWQWSPNSGGWYSTAATVQPNGAFTALGLTGGPAIAYTLDGEGRPDGASAGSSPLASSGAYDAAGQLQALTLGSKDSDAYQYDAATGRLDQYQFTIGGQTDTGTVKSWNPDGTIAEFWITDNVTGSGDTQQCSYGHDALGRLTSASCGSGVTWAQNFSYDPFGNLQTAGNPGLSFDPGYNGNNQITTVGGINANYDLDGNLLNDPAQSASQVNQFDANGSATEFENVNVTYDALGRAVEAAESSGTIEFLYGPAGRKLAVMSGQTETRADIALPGGDLAEFSGTTLDFYGHADALGSIRAESTPLQKLAAYVAFTPFGEDETSTSGASRIFTGQHQDLSPTTDAGQGQYDFLYREFSPVQARWWTPDPLGAAAANPNDPQSWNEYAYVRGTPLTSTDPLGLFCPYGGGCTAMDAATGGWEGDALGGGWNELDILSSSLDWLPGPGNTTQPVLLPNGTFQMTVNVSNILIPVLTISNLDQLAASGSPAFGGFETAQFTANSGIVTVSAIRSGRSCGGILAKGAVTAGLDALAIIPVEGEFAAAFYGGKEAFEAVREGAALTSTALAVSGSDQVGTNLGVGGIAIEVAEKNPTLIKDTAEAIPLVGRGIAVIATGWDLFSTIRNYGTCRGW